MDYLYDATGRLSAIWASNGDSVSFLYDAGGRLVEKWLPNGIATRYVYNADNTLQQLTNLRGSLVLSQHSYTYDQVGNRLTQAEESCDPVTYTYDALNRLLDVRHSTTNMLLEGYTYDALGNRLTKTTPSVTEAYVYDPANQLTEVHQGTTAGPLLTSLQYDDNGNLVAKTSAEGVTQLTYDAFNQLTQASKTWEAPQSYAYDDQGRRISKTAGSSTTQYLYNGLNLFAEYGATWNNAAARYTHGPGVDAPISRATPTTAQYYHQDGLGSVVGVSDQAGATTATAHYDTYGNRTAMTGAIPQYGYTGREPDETGLVYYRSRYYDPALGRFAQRDPIEFQGGLNLYAYAGGNPVNFTDPMGTSPQSPTLPSTDGSASGSGAGNVPGSGMSAGNQNLAAVNPPPADTASIIQQAGASPGSGGPSLLQQIGNALSAIGNAALTAAQFIWNAPNTAIGLAYLALNVAASPFLPQSNLAFGFGNGALQVTGAPLNSLLTSIFGGGSGGAVTLGNIQLYGGSYEAARPTNGFVGPMPGLPYLPSSEIQSYTGNQIILGKHEGGHVVHGNVLGPFFLPVWAFLGGASNTNPLERGADSYALGGSAWSSP